MDGDASGMGRPSNMPAYVRCVAIVNLENVSQVNVADWLLYLETPDLFRFARNLSRSQSFKAFLSINRAAPQSPRQQWENPIISRSERVGNFGPMTRVPGTRSVI
jgi:hypothetical protein